MQAISFTHTLPMGSNVIVELDRYSTGAWEWIASRTVWSWTPETVQWMVTGLKRRKPRSRALGR